MKTANSGISAPPTRIWEQTWELLEEVSDESGEHDLGEGYLLKYEGWGEICVGEFLGQVREEQGIGGQGGITEEEAEQACHEFAERESHTIVTNEWKPLLEKRGYGFVEGGYCRGGLYGRTWALFKKLSKYTIR